MRHEKAEQLLRLCLMMASRAQGVSIEMIQQEFSVSRRTAERMRDAALRLLPQVDERTDESGFKYWRATDVPKGLISVSAEEIGTLNSASEIMKTSNRPDAAKRLQDIATKLLASQSRGRQFQLAPDVELLMQSEGLALRPGPRVAVSVEHIETIREAILGSSRIAVSYKKRHSQRARDVTLEPYGILYGQRPYLIAKQQGKPAVRHYRLQGLSNVEILNEMFVRDEDFDLSTYDKQLFGVFNEPAFDVCWRFRPDAADDAEEYIFHPDQKAERGEDGSLYVRFRAGGAREMAWHLYTWGDSVEVIEPKDFCLRVGKLNVMTKL
jgi:predicted DNA-binding transcriptional regulator YafY